MIRLPAEPPPGPKLKVFEPEGDFKKKGDDMFPTGGPSFVRLKMLLVLIENVSAYGRCTAGCCGGLCAAPASVVRGAPGGGAGGSIALPNLNDLLTLKLTETNPGPRPKFRGMISCPGD